MELGTVLEYVDLPAQTITFFCDPIILAIFRFFSYSRYHVKNMASILELKLKRREFIASALLSKEVQPKPFTAEIYTFHRLRNKDDVLRVVYPVLQRGIRFTSVLDIARHFKGEIDISTKNNALLTFDDGYQSHMYALEASEYAQNSWGERLHPVFGVMPQFGYRWMDDINPSMQSYDNGGHDTYLTLEQLMAIAGAGHELANHTIDHANLTSLKDEEVADQIRFAQSKIDWIYDKVGRPGQFWHRTLIYPYGSYNSRVIDIAKRQNVGLAFSTERRSLHHPSTQYNIGRIGVT